jgi:hypothetical protein
MIFRPETRTWPGRLLLLGGMFLVLSGAAWLPVQAAPVPCFDEIVNGDFLIIGSTIGYDCGSGVDTPVATTTACSGLFDSDSAFDLVWLDNDGSPDAAASAARTSARLDLPEDATVIRAQLYWAGLAAGNGDSSVEIDRDDGTVTPTLSVRDDSDRDRARSVSATARPRRCADRGPPRRATHFPRGCAAATPALLWPAWAPGRAAPASAAARSADWRTLRAGARARAGASPAR